MKHYGISVGEAWRVREAIKEVEKSLAELAEAKKAVQGKDKTRITKSMTALTEDKERLNSKLVNVPPLPMTSEEAKVELMEELDRMIGRYAEHELKFDAHRDKWGLVSAMDEFYGDLCLSREWSAFFLWVKEQIEKRPRDMGEYWAALLKAKKVVVHKLIGFRIPTWSGIGTRNIKELKEYEAYREMLEGRFGQGFPRLFTMVGRLAERVHVGLVPQNSIPGPWNDEIWKEEEDEA